MKQATERAAASQPAFDTAESTMLNGAGIVETISGIAAGEIPRQLQQANFHRL
jgi:hypothetical protein